MPHKTYHILSTKVLPAVVMQDAAATGLTVHCLPFISTETVQDKNIASQIQAFSLQPIHAVFTSAKAVAAVAAQLHNSPQWHIYALFGATQQALQTYFPQSTIYAQASHSAQLAQQLVQLGTKHVHFFCGNQRMDTLPEKLAAAGVGLQEHVVYHTQATPHVVTKHYDGVLFFSPSAVKSFFEVNTLREGVACFAIGTTTAKALAAYTKNCIIASEPTVAAMIAAAQQYFNTKR